MKENKTTTNVITFKPRKKSEAKKSSGETTKADGAQLIDMTARRQAEMDSERRRVTRTVLEQFVGAFVVMKDNVLMPVNLYDVSETGMAVDIANDYGAFEVGEVLTIRLYLSHDTYFTFQVKTANRRPVEGRGVTRHGMLLKDKDQESDTLYYFMKFLQSVSRVAKRDTGERIVGRVD